MKLKRKLFSLIGAGAVIIPTVASLVSCTFTKRDDEDDPVEPEKEEYSCPTVSYNGSAVMTPSEGIKTYTLEGFKFSRKLYTGESVKVNVVSQTNASIQAVPSYSSASDKMSIKFTASVTNVNADEKFKFKLTFDFTYQNETKSFTTLDKVFEFQYKGTWKSNKITNGFTTEPYAITAQLVKEQTKATFTVDNLLLQRPIEKNTGEDLIVTTNNEQYAHCTGWTQDSSSGQNKLTLAFDINIPSYYLNHSDVLELTFQFTSNKKVKYTQILTGCGVEYKRNYVEPELKFNGEETDKTFSALKQIVPQEGKVVTKLSTDLNSVLYTTRALKTEEPFNETLSIKLVSDTELTKSFDEMTALDDLTLDYDVTSAGITTSGLVYTPHKDEDDISYVNDTVLFNIAWKITENNSEWGEDIKSKEGHLDGFTYKFTPIWQPKKVEVVGYSKTDTNVINLPKGQWNYIFNSNSEQGFKVEGEFADNEEVYVTLTKVGTGDNVVLMQNKAAIIKDQNDSNISYLSFEIGFDENAKQFERIDHDGQFKLSFTFKVGDEFTYEQSQETTPEIYQLHFEKLPASIEITVDNQLKVVEGETLKTFTGVWKTDLPFEKLNGLTISNVRSNATETPAENVISLLTSETMPYGITKDGSNIAIYTKIIPTNGYIDETLTFDLKFSFANEEYVVKDVKVLYTKFSESVDTFIKARTIPMVLYAENVSETGYDKDNNCYDVSYDRVFFDMWVGKKAPSTTGSNYAYYLITTKSNRAIFEKFINNHTRDYSNHADYKIHFGMTDSSFVTNYKQGSSGTQFQASSYLRNYLYCDYTALKWVNDEIKWSNGKNSNIAVATFDFNQSFKDFDDKDVQNNPEWEKSYLNKLWELDNYASQLGYGTVNPQPNAPLTAETKGDYSTYGFGGFYSQQYQNLYDCSETPKFTNTTQTVTRWDCDDDSNASNLSYSSQAKTNNKIYYLADTRTKSYSYYYGVNIWNPSYSWSDTGIVSGSPYYTADSKSSGVIDGYNIPSNWSLVGSLVVAKKTKNLALTECPIQVIGIYTGWDYSITWTNRTFSFTPYIEVFNNGSENILKDYI